MNPELGKRETKQFASFLAAVMQLDPNDRPTAAQLLKHQWING